MLLVNRTAIPSLRRPTLLTESSIRASLGGSGRLDFQRLVRAAERGVAEDEPLDWKSGDFRTPLH